MSDPGAASRAHWGLEGFSLGISIGAGGDADHWQRNLDWVARADALGVHSVWVPEMHFAQGVTASPLIALAALAARAPRLRVGTTSLLLPIHDPLHLARQIAALDRLTGGRMIVGLGRGFRAPLFRAFGIDPASKRDRFDDALDTILEAWRSDPECAPRQRPHPPLAVAAFGPKGLQQSARRGLPYLPSPMEPLEQIAENLALHRKHLPEGLDPLSLVVPAMRTVHVANDDAEAARVRDALEQETERMRGAAPRALARAAQASVDERAIIGTQNAVADRLGAARELLGLDLLVARPQVPGASASEQRDALERLATRVWPQVAA